MSTPSIELSDLGKRYLLGQRSTATTLAEAVKERLGGGPRKRPREFWALRDVSLEVRPGEVLGIVGRNGAGKSTMLKVIGGITDPTEGHGVIRGRVGLLLEVGTGFHPELSGRDNVYLNGAILGMSRADIARNFDDIVEFAEIGNFLDVPVKRYSSGMYVRLAFSVAAHLEPDILIVDEVLAVGDAAFQKKSLGKMDEVAGAGRTVIFISHNMRSIERLCTRCVWLDGGRLVGEGDPRTVVRDYLGVEEPSRREWRRGPADHLEDTPVHLTRLALETADPGGAAYRGDEPIQVVLEYRVDEPVRACQIGVRVVTSEGAAVLTTTDCDGLRVQSTPRRPGAYEARFEIPPFLLPPGRYSLTATATEPMRQHFDLQEDVVTFEVAQKGSLVELDSRHGAVAPLLAWSTAHALDRVPKR